jgi:NodT family efflux transporter outer membrane factor (OMF) lipoprotein
LKAPVALVIAVALAGCTVGPDFRVPDFPAVDRFAPGPAPEIALEARPDRDIPAEWWSLFGVPELDALVRRALTGSPTLAEARARLTEARAGATDIPAVNLDVGVVRQRIDPATVGFPQAPNPGPFTVYTVGANVSYTFDVFGGTRRELEGLAAQIDYQAYELEAARLTLAANVVTTAIRIAALRAEIETNEAIVTTQLKDLAIAEERLALGAVSQLDVRNKQAQVADARASLQPLYALRESAIHLLAIYMGDAPAAAPIPSLRLADLKLPAAIPLRLPSALARQRPDIRASEALLHRASADVGVATANLYPKLQISGGFASSQLSASDLFSNGFNIWNIGANLLQPLLQPLLHSGELQARKRAAIAAYEEAEAAYRQAVLQGLQNVADVLRALEADARAESMRSEQSARAKDAYRITVDRYDAGGVSQIAVLDAQRASLRAEAERLQASANRLSDAAALFQALGGGWWENTDSRPPVTDPPAKVSTARQLP